MGKKKKNSGKKKTVLKELMAHDCKIKCCKKFKKGEDRRCKRCPCYDLLKEVA